jgi:hypothetical protein
MLIKSGKHNLFSGVDRSLLVELFASISLTYNAENTFLNDLVALKLGGNNLDFKQIAPLELERLAYENIPDSKIADLFGINTKNVTKKRCKLGILCNRGYLLCRYGGDRYPFTDLPKTARGVLGSVKNKHARSTPTYKLKVRPTS